MSSNGQSTVVDTEGLSVDEKLDLALQALADLSEELTLLREEMTLRFDNISVSGDGFDFEDLDES